MKIFIAHSIGLREICDDYVDKLEKAGHSVYYPARDTQQFDIRKILCSNLDGLKWCDEVHCLWDGSSLGTIFDLGCAYALNKPVKIVYTKPKHWCRLIMEWEGQYLPLKMD